ncbi:RAMP superfamily CRISPR-associated protein [Oscillatoria sp. FACHB-1406]|uniref:RAMP superfamily CRISPR-associated protein n=1 Tax=Oscillatoria sp. FACHB-1406 TaxID=2692846 RepID=UPI001685B150|nr:RAMP superfamily CRISPR-associated protein [Oscillatoria sp. FACHB-1406]MBD2580123.1 type III-B CRISPR module RAMP protein Cmr6 [Oscillatoria sp. FACHB-1406]
MNPNYPGHPYPLWLREDRQFKPNNTASFVEYLRWMRQPEREIDSSERVQIQISKESQAQNNFTKEQVLHKAVEKASHYAEYFKQKNRQTALIAGEENTFSAQGVGRSRVGGIRGPESILLPAFDARGMPYIPSSSLRGVARSQGVRAIARERIARLEESGQEITPLDWDAAREQAEREIARYFGDLDATEADRAGKVIFLDAYPCGKTWGNSEKGLAIDMANSIWSWEGDNPSYKPNPNLFLSLRNVKLIVGLRPGKFCDRATFERVRNWLIEGLQLGIGSQVNSGCGAMEIAPTQSLQQPFFQVNFSLTGQLIHSYQKTEWNAQKNKFQTVQSEAEVRAIAFKSMLRYWFRTWARGVLPAEVIRDRLEPQLFGSIQPQIWGWLTCRVEETSHLRPRTQLQGKEGNCLQQQGILKLSYSPQAPEFRYDAIARLFVNLTWLMFHLGGVGQGARRPLYSRQNRTDPKPPWYRGCDLRATRIEPSEIAWERPETLERFAEQFQQRVREFYCALGELAGAFEGCLPLPVRGEAIAQFSRIVVCTGDAIADKPFALGILHQQAHLGNGRYDPDLCGDANSNPSPIWIANLGQYQVVTVFDSDREKRQLFLNNLQQNATNYQIVWNNPSVANSLETIN